MTSYQVDLRIGGTTIHFIIHGKTAKQIREDLSERYPNGHITLLKEYSYGT